MNLSADDFPAFFAAVRGGHDPYAWQMRLLDHLLTEQRWPDAIDAPTGTGKTAVVDVHVFACALMGVGDAPRLPRRLSVVVDRRVVVDAHDQHARMLAERLASTRAGVLGDVADALRALRSGDPDRDDAPLVTARLRGGAPPPRSWRDDPEGCLVLVGTPDMWGSRLLFGGYGSSRYARSREAGLLAYDSVVVVDEAHLSRQLVVAAGRVAQLTAATSEPLPVPVLQVVQTTATQASDTGGTVVGLREADLDADDGLARRIRLPKPVRHLSLPVWPSTDRSRKHATDVITAEVTALREKYGATVGCVLNRVADAMAVADALRTRGLQVETLVGRLRPADVHALPEGLLTVDGTPEVDVLVATQTVEVGVDLDLSALVTDLAPGSALAQRAGRVNRLGLRETGPVTVIVPAGDVPAEVAPYRTPDLERSRAWLPLAGLAPGVLHEDPPPSPGSRRLLLQRLENADTWLLARTSDDLFAPPDLELWLSEDLEPDPDLGLVVRRLPADPADAAAAVILLPPQADEVFPVSRRIARSLAALWLPDDSQPLLVLLVRAGEVAPLDAATRSDLRPGDILVVPADRAVVAGGIVSDDPEATSTDVFETGVDRSGSAAVASLRVGEHSLLDGPDAAAVVDLARGRVPVGEQWTHTDKRALAEWISALAKEGDALSGAVAAASRLLRVGHAAEVTVEWLPSGDESPTTLVIVDQRRLVADEDLRQTWSCADLPVPLDVHQAQVGMLARRYAENLGLGPVLADALEAAGRHHDDGKADERFQRMLGRVGEPLAKSGRRRRIEEEQARAGSGLPSGWRHEQLSALIVWSSVDGVQDRELVTRLVGTTHGRGRVGFPHTSGGLLPPSDDAAREPARALFDEGGWDELVESTDRRFGVWGTAYLEAVLRAADGQVSRNGS